MDHARLRALFIFDLKTAHTGVFLVAFKSSELQKFLQKMCQKASSSSESSNPSYISVTLWFKGSKIILAKWWHCRHRTWRCFWHHSAFMIYLDRQHAMCLAINTSKGHLETGMRYNFHPFRPGWVQRSEVGKISESLKNMGFKSGNLSESFLEKMVLGHLVQLQVEVNPFVDFHHLEI